MAKFVNIAHPNDSAPNIINVDDIVRIRPGLIESGWSGKDEACTIYLRMTWDSEYDDDNRLWNEPATIEVHLTTREICRRLQTDVFVV